MLMKKALFLFILFGLFCFAYFGRYQPVSLDVAKPTTIRVEIKGEVVNPGVYTLKIDATLDDLVKQAGGFTEQAQTDSLSLMNPLEDQDTIFVSKRTETQKISLNSATLEQLDSLPGIGPSIAQRIIDYRNNIPFVELEQIKEVKGIGDKLYEKIKDLITL